MSLEGFLDGLERLERFGEALSELTQKRRASAQSKARGEIELVEIRPGVYGVPRQPSPAQAARDARNPFAELKGRKWT